MSTGEETGPESLADLFERVRREVTQAVRLADWAEDEIGQAMKRHPGEADRIYHAFPLLTPTVSSRAWGTEFVVRGHCRELLDRIGTGGNTKRGTAAECCMLMSEVSQAVPLHGAASGFYLRMWAQAFEDHQIWAYGQEHHEALYGPQIDDLEREVRRKLAIPGRRLEALAIECDGEHWGQTSDCRFARPATQKAS